MKKQVAYINPRFVVTIRPSGDVWIMELLNGDQFKIDTEEAVNDFVETLDLLAVDGGKED